MPTPTIRPLPDSDVAVAAMRFVKSRVPEFVLHHSVRGYIYGRELAGQNGLQAGRDYDDELLFLGNVLHDLGVAAGAEKSPERFEVHGADQAVEFARSAGVAADKLPVLWDAVALHTSVGIANRKQPEVAITHLGISADILGQARDQLPPDLVAAVHEQYPRRDLGYALTELIVAQARHNPMKATPLTFAGHLLGLHMPLGATPTWFDVLAGAGWSDRPVSKFATEGTDSPEQLAVEFTSRLARRDVDGLVALYDPSAVFMPAPGRIARGRDEIRAALAEMVVSGATVDLEPQASHVTADQAVIANKATVRAPGSDGAQTVMTTEVARRRADGRWFYLVDDPFFMATTA